MKPLLTFCAGMLVMAAIWAIVGSQLEIREPMPTPVAFDPTKPFEIETTQPAQSARYYASKQSDKFHRPTCEWARKISSWNLTIYTTREEAIAAGLKPCRVCRP